jgi:hypothetical protein
MGLIPDDALPGLENPMVLTATSDRVIDGLPY